MREYGPLVAVVITWLAVAAATGPANAVRLLAAVTLVRAARAVTAPATLAAVRRRLGNSARGRQAIRTAIAVEAIALAGALVALAALLGLLSWAGEDKMLVLCLSFGPAIAARLLMPLGAGRALGKVYRLALGIVGLLLVAAGWVAGADVYVFALLFAARDWLALPIAFLLAPPVEPPEEPTGPLRWPEIAAHSYALGRRRAAYRFSKSFLQVFLGPLGGFAARTGRGMQLDRRFVRFVPDHPATLGAVAFAAATAATALIALVPEPLLLVVAASLFRMSAAAANVLLWRWLARGIEIATLADEDDEE